MDAERIEKVYTVREVADMLKLSTRTIYNYLKKQKIKAVRVGVQYRIPKTEVDRLLNESEEVNE